jgi:hypothetical protein
MRIGSYAPVIVSCQLDKPPAAARRVSEMVSVGSITSCRPTRFREALKRRWRGDRLFVRRNAGMGRRRL